MNRSALRVSLALGSGAAWGYAHIGVLLALNELGITPVAVAGTSMGSLIGGLFAAGLTPERMANIAGSVDMKTVARIFAPSLHLSGLISGRGVYRYLRDLIGEPCIEELRMPFCAVAMDLTSGEEVVFNTGSLLGSIRASISVPIIFSPVVADNRILIDGGLVDPVPVDMARKLAPEHPVIAVNVLRSIPRLNRVRSVQAPSRHETEIPGITDLLRARLEGNRKHIPSLAEITLRTLGAGQSEIAVLRLETNHPDALIEPNLKTVRMSDFHRASVAIKAGRDAAIRSINPSVIDQLRNFS